MQSHAVYIRVDDYYITPLVMHANTDRVPKKEKWHPDVQSFVVPRDNSSSDFLFL